MTRILNFVLNVFIIFVFFIQFVWGYVNSDKYVAISPDKKYFIPVYSEKQKKIYKNKGYRIIKKIFLFDYKEKKENSFADNTEWYGCEEQESPEIAIKFNKEYAYQSIGVPKDKINEFLNRTVAKGEGVKIAVLDLGFDVSHEDLQGQVISTCNPVYNNQTHNYNCDSDVLPDSYNCVSNNIAYHGTATLGVMAAKEDDDDIVTGIAPKAKYMLYKINNTAQFLYAIYHAVDNGADIITSQLLFKEISTKEPWSKELYDAIKYAYEHGVIFIASAGNRDISDDFANCITIANGMLFKIGAFNYYPTEYVEHQYILGEYTKYSIEHYPEGFSNPDIYADFYVIEEFFPSLLPDNKYTSVWAGTSFSAPAFAGFVADMLSVNPYLNYQDIKEIMSFALNSEYIYIKTYNVCNEPYIDKNKLPTDFCQNISPYKATYRNSFAHPVNLYKALSLTSIEFKVNIQNGILTSDIIIPPISHPADVYIWIELPNKNKYYLNYSNNKGLYFINAESPIVTDYYYNKVLQFQYFGEHGWFAPVTTQYLPKGTYKFCGRYKVNGKWLGYHYCTEFDIQ